MALTAVFVPLNGPKTKVSIPSIDPLNVNSFHSFGKRLATNQRQIHGAFNTLGQADSTEFCKLLFESGFDTLKKHKAQTEQDTESTQNLEMRLRLQQRMTWTSAVFRISVAVVMEERKNLASYIDLSEQQKTLYRKLYQHFECSGWDDLLFFEVFGDCFEHLPMRLDVVVKILEDPRVQFVARKQQEHYVARAKRKARKLELFREILQDAREKGAAKSRKSRKLKAQKKGLHLTEEQLPELWKALFPKASPLSDVTPAQVLKKLAEHVACTSKTELNKIFKPFKTVSEEEE